MSRTERLYKIEMLIRQQAPVPLRRLLEVLEVSPATVKRDLEYLRDRLGAPIVYDAQDNGYRFGAEYRGQRHELPGLWFDQRELHGLLMAHQLLAELDSPGLLGRHLQPLLDRIQALLAAGGADAAALMQRVRIISPAKRPVDSGTFDCVAGALLRRRRLHLRYLTRGRREVGERDVSPQRLVHHRNTWYLDAWCHRRERLLRFALDAMQEARELDRGALELPVAKVQREMDAGYGVFAGATPRRARLRFDPQAAQWASREQWHPDQQGAWLPDGSYELQVPYVDETELAMDVLRQGPEVRVLEPASLAQRVHERLRAAAALYDGLTDNGDS